MKLKEGSHLSLHHLSESNPLLTENNPSTSIPNIHTSIQNKPAHSSAGFFYSFPGPLFLPMYKLKYRITINHRVITKILSLLLKK